jgi:hypothetical protein
MITIADLETCAESAKEVEDLLRLIQLYCEPAPNVPTLTGMPNGGRDSNPTEGVVLSVERLRERWEDAVKRLSDRMYKVERALDELSGNTYEVQMRRVMRLYYFEGLTWEWVEKRMDYCRSRCIEFRDLAVEILKVVGRDKERTQLDYET